MEILHVNSYHLAEAPVAAWGAPGGLMVSEARRHSKGARRARLNELDQLVGPNKAHLSEIDQLVGPNKS